MNPENKQHQLKEEVVSTAQTVADDIRDASKAIEWTTHQLISAEKARSVLSRKIQRLSFQQQLLNELQCMRNEFIRNPGNARKEKTYIIGPRQGRYARIPCPDVLREVLMFAASADEVVEAIKKEVIIDSNHIKVAVVLDHSWLPRTGKLSYIANFILSI